MNIKKITLSFLIFFICNAAYSISEPQKITIKDAVRIAVEKNLDIQSSRLNDDISMNLIKTANKLQNPGIGVFYNFGRAGKGNPQQIGISQTVEIGKRNARKNLANANLELVKRNIEYLEFDLRMDVREAYTNLLAKKSVLTTMETQKELLSKMIELANEKYKLGDVSEIDVLQAQLLLNQIITEVNSAKYDVKTALFEFNKVINSNDSFYDTFEEKFPDDYEPLITPCVEADMPEFDKISSESLNNRFDIQIAKQQIDVAEKNLINIIKQRIPDFEIQGGYSYQNSGQSDDGKFKNGAYLGINLINLPILYNYGPEIKNAKLELEQAKLNYASVENKALNDLKKTYEKFLTAQLNLRNYNKHLLANSESLILVSRKSYKDGKIDLTTLITMEESYRMITVAYTYAIADYYNAWNAFIREVNNENFIIYDVVDDL